jgi:hypothetical protein
VRRIVMVSEEAQAVRERVEGKVRQTAGYGFTSLARKLCGLRGRLTLVVGVIVNPSLWR